MKTYPVSIIITTIILVCMVQWTHAQSPVKISGTVVESKTKEPVPFVHVYTRSLSAGTTTNEHGKFMVQINPSDTLVFSAVGFDKYFFSLKQDDLRPYYEVVIELDFRTYELAPVKVTAWKDVEQFKKDILELDIPTPEKEFKINIPRNARVYDDPKLNNNLGNDMGGGVTLQGPIDALYNAFSRQGKQLKKLDALKEENVRRREIESRYNIEVVQRITSLNEEGARRFMEWCKFEDEFLLTSSEYDLTVAVLRCLEDFSKNDTLN